MTPHQFTLEFAEAIRVSKPSLGVSVESDLEIRLTHADGTDSTVFADNAYQTYLQDPDSKSDVIHRYVLALVEEGIRDVPVDREHIVPVIKDRPWVTEMDQSLEGRDGKMAGKFVFEELNAELLIVYAVDSSKSIRYLTSEDLSALGIGRSELRVLAVDNLRRILPKVELTEGPLFSMISAGGAYDASLLLLTEVWTGGSIHVAGDIVVAIPSRDVLLVSGSKNVEGLAKMRELATKSAQDAPYRLTDALFVYRDGRFTRFDG